MRQEPPNKPLLLLGCIVALAATVFHATPGIFNSAPPDQPVAFQPGETLCIWQMRPDDSDVLVFADRDSTLRYAQKVKSKDFNGTEEILENENAWFVKGGTRCEFLGSDLRLAEVNLANGRHAGKKCVVYTENLFRPAR